LQLRHSPNLFLQRHRDSNQGLRGSDAVRPIRSALLVLFSCGVERVTNVLDFDIS